MPRERPKATCHPDRPHKGHGLCAACFQRWLRQNNPRKAICHPARAHLARGLCSSCYQMWLRATQPAYAERKKIIDARYRDRNRASLNARDRHKNYERRIRREDEITRLLKALA